MTARQLLQTAVQRIHIYISLMFSKQLLVISKLLRNDWVPGHYLFVTGMVGDIHLIGSKGVGSWTAMDYTDVMMETMLPFLCGNEYISY